MTDSSVPTPTLRRLPAYLQYLKELKDKGQKLISCSVIGRDLGLDPTQIRKDLEITGVVGKPKVGYQVAQLLEAIENFIGWNSVHEAFLVGTTGLGSALLGYDGLEQFGLRIVRIFDLDYHRIGEWIHGQEVFPAGYLPDLARRLKVQIGIITVPAGSAQHVADLMVEGGMKAIWNFAATKLRVPEGMIVEDEHFYYSLAALSSRLRRLPEARGAGRAV